MKNLKIAHRECIGKYSGNIPHIFEKSLPVLWNFANLLENLLNSMERFLKTLEISMHLHLGMFLQYVFAFVAVRFKHNYNNIQSI